MLIAAPREELQMAPTYMNAVVTHALDNIVTETAHELGCGVPADPAHLTEAGWLLHGAVSDLAIRRRIYSNDNTTPSDAVIAMHVRAFLTGAPALLPAQNVPEREARAALPALISRIPGCPPSFRQRVALVLLGFHLQSSIAWASGCRLACPRISRSSAISTRTIVRPTKSSVAC